MAKSVNSLLSPTTELPPPEQVFEWPQKAAREQNWPEAAQRWAVLRKAYPNQAATWIQGAIAYIEVGALDHAEELLAHARQNFPDNPDALTQSAEVAMRQQYWEKAETFLLQTREQFPNDIQSWIKFAEYFERQGNLNQALENNEIARQRFPDRPGPYFQHAELAMRAEQWEQALERWEVVCSKFPNLPAGYLRAAEAARQLNRLRDARQLTLAYEYGADVIDEATYAHKPVMNQPVKHTRLRGLSELIWTKAIFNLRSEVHRNYLSYGWWVLEPLLHMLVFYVVFGLLLQRGGENYPVFLLTGLIPWMWFNKGVMGSSSSIIGGQTLMIQVGLPAIFFPLVSLLQTAIKEIPVFVMLFAFLWLQGFTPDISWWALLPVVLVQLIVMTAFACGVAAVIPFARDLSYLVPTGLMFLMLCSGIFYDYQIIPGKWQELFLLNPMAFLLKCYRDIFIDGVVPDLNTLSLWGLGGAITCLLLMLIYQRLRYVYPRIVLV